MINTEDLQIGRDGADLLHGLLEARRLLLDGTHSVTEAAMNVGYDSPTQFSREYSRKFGHPPRDDRR